MSNIYLACLAKAEYLMENGYPVGKIDLAQLTDLLVKLENEKIEKQTLSDAVIDYNDTIVEIIELGELETVDLSVSGDNLFYCNDILTKNSFGLPATADLMFALVTSEEMEKLNQVMVKQLKNRYSDISKDRRFFVGLDKSRMKFYDLEDSAQRVLNDDVAIMDQTPTGKRINDELRDKMKDFK